MHEWFKHLNMLCSKNGIQDKDIYNFNKTGFAMGLIATIRLLLEQKSREGLNYFNQASENGLPPLNALI
jgi:hypothetical protein